MTTSIPPPSTSPPGVIDGSDGLVTSFAVSGGGTDRDRMNAVAVDSVGGVVAAGHIESSSATFGGVVLTNSADNYSNKNAVRPGIIHVIWCE